MFSMRNLVVVVLFLIATGIATIAGYGSRSLPTSASIQTGLHPAYRVRQLGSRDLLTIPLTGRTGLTVPRTGFTPRTPHFLLLSTQPTSPDPLEPTRALDRTSLLVSQAARVNLPPPVLSMTMLRPLPGTAFLQSDAGEWGYTEDNGPRVWRDMYPQCSGRKQSPVNIRTDRVRYLAMANVEFVNYQPLTDTFMITNNGYTVKVIPQQPETVTGMDMRGTMYTVAEVHFHWSSNRRAGSEHAINGVRFPLEMHMVTFASQYGSLENAKKQPDGLAVLAVIYDIGAENTAMWSIIASNSMLNYVGEKRTLAGLDLNDLMPDSLSPFFRYRGSLTTPPCLENVMWTVCENVQTLSQQQFDMFQYLRRGRELGNMNENVLENSRPVQDSFQGSVFSNNKIFDHLS